MVEVVLFVLGVVTGAAGHKKITEAAARREALKEQAGSGGSKDVPGRVVEK